MKRICLNNVSERHCEETGGKCVQADEACLASGDGNLSNYEVYIQTDCFFPRQRRDHRNDEISCVFWTEPK